MELSEHLGHFLSQRRRMEGMAEGLLPLQETEAGNGGLPGDVGLAETGPDDGHGGWHMA